ncbi:hypothetical protein OK016_26230 [Vibrio chagasii]|nr:hypothetical protein [Vibrio chagasii]
MRVPAYSLRVAAEHTVGMMMCLNCKLYKAYQRTRDANFRRLGWFQLLRQNCGGVIGSAKLA